LIEEQAAVYETEAAEEIAPPRERTDP